jgi:N6-adenosine-specific RNA methylase IME4
VNSLALRQEVNNAIQGRIDPVELATVIYPRIEQALQLAITPEEVKEIRAQTAAVQEYIKRKLPEQVASRAERFKIAFPGERLYCEESAKLGTMWNALANRAQAGDNQYTVVVTTVTTTTDIFSSRADALRCMRAGEIDSQDREIYYEEQRQKAQQPTVNGLERVWHMFYDGRGGETPLPEGKFRVIYADPPWQYGDRFVDGYGSVDFTYPTMTIAELCQLPVWDLVADDAVLFIWVTSPLLEDAFKVVRAWGFEYKTSFVWDKVKHNYGHYNSVRHEFLLVCTKGSCTPDDLELFDSVQMVERSNKHSEKPEEFRRIIDSLYTWGQRIELFARRKVEGWEAWGNDVR